MKFLTYINLPRLTLTPDDFIKYMELGEMDKVYSSNNGRDYFFCNIYEYELPLTTDEMSYNKDYYSNFDSGFIKTLITMDNRGNVTIKYKRVSVNF